MRSNEPVNITEDLATSLQNLVRDYEAGLLGGLGAAGKGTSAQTLARYGIAQSSIAIGDVGNVTLRVGPDDNPRNGDTVSVRNRSGRTIAALEVVPVTLPVHGRWAILPHGSPGSGSSSSTDPDDPCGCTKCLPGYVQNEEHTCTECGCIIPTRFPQIPVVTVRYPGFDAFVWEDFPAKASTVKHVGACIWQSKWIPITAQRIDEEDEEVEGQELYRLNIDFSAGEKRAWIERQVVMDGAEPVESLFPLLELEWTMCPSDCGDPCICGWKFKRSKWRYVFPASCDLCVAVAAATEDGECWNCDTSPPDTYEIEFASGGIYYYRDAEFQPQTAANPFAGQKIKVQHIARCENYLGWGEWDEVEGDCKGLPIAEWLFATSYDQPCSGECHLYEYEGESGKVWLFSSMATDRVKLDVTVWFASGDRHSRDDEFGDQRAFWRLEEPEPAAGDPPGPGTTPSGNWCAEEEYTLRPSWYSIHREFYDYGIHHWYEDADDMNSEGSYTVTQDDIDTGKLFGYKAQETPYGGVGFIFATGTAGSVTWLWAYNGHVVDGESVLLSNYPSNGAEYSCGQLGNYLTAEDQLNVIVRPSTRDFPEHDGGPDREDCPAGDAPDEACVNAECVLVVHEIDDEHNEWRPATVEDGEPNCGECDGDCYAMCGNEVVHPVCGDANSFSVGQRCALGRCDAPLDLGSYVEITVAAGTSGTCPCATGQSLRLCLEEDGSFVGTMFLCGDLVTLVLSEGESDWTLTGTGLTVASAATIEGPFDMNVYWTDPTCDSLQITVTVLT